MRKKKMIVPILAAMCMSLTACVENPEEDIVQNKDFDVMIEEAENTAEDAVYYEEVVEEVIENAKVYQTEIIDESLGVEVYVDADIIIPEVEKLSVYRVSQQEISQEFLDKVRETISPGVSYCDGSVTSIATKAEVAINIQGLKEELKTCGDDLVEEYERLLEELEIQYENAPETIDITAYPSDNLIHSVEEKYNSNPNDGYYSWQYSMTPSAKVFYGMSDGADGHCRALYLQNNCDYGNCIRYESTRNGYAWISAVYLEDGIVDAPKNEDGNIEFSESQKPVGVEATLFDNETLTISETDARAVADKLMIDLGLDEYTYCEGGIYCEIPEIRFKDGETFVLYYDGVGYREIYEFVYMRNIDGVFVDNTAGEKFKEGWSDDVYNKQIWGGEAVIIYVNDDGIVGFKYMSPISVGETLVEKASIKSFEEVKEIFEQMVVIDNAPIDGSVTIEVDSVELVYARISEKDSFDTGVLVPVWNFSGTMTSEYGLVTEGTVLSINAIDGSVIDWELGY